MQQNKLYRTVVLLSVCLGHLLTAQNARQDITAINNAYKKLQKLSMTFEMNMYENYSSQVVYYSERTYIEKNGANTFQRSAESECITTPDYSVMLDKQEKEIVYAPRKTNFNPADAGVAIDTDSLLRFCKSSKFFKLSPSLFSYEFIMPDEYPDYNKIVVCFEPETFLIKKIVFYCEEDDISIDNEKEKLSKARIEINYKDINTKPELTGLSYEKYLVKSGDKFKLRSEYGNYHLTVLSF